VSSGDHAGDEGEVCRHDGDSFADSEAGQGMLALVREGSCDA
jgi:hypothetical protein